MSCEHHANDRCGRVRFPGRHSLCALSRQRWALGEVKMERRISPWWLVLAGVASAVVTIGLIALLTNIFKRQQEGRNPFYRVVELTDTTVDPAVWGKNFP